MKKFLVNASWSKEAPGGVPNVDGKVTEHDTFFVRDQIFPSFENIQEFAVKHREAELEDFKVNAISNVPDQWGANMVKPKLPLTPKEPESE